MNGIGIIVLTVIVAVLTAIITLIWWKVGDQWADEEYKKFGHGGGGPKGPPPTVIEDFDRPQPTHQEAGDDPRPE